MEKEKSKKLRTIATVIIVLGLIVASIIMYFTVFRGGRLDGNGGSGSFKIANVKKIQIGDNKSDVYKCVGTADEDNGAEYIYYGKDYKKIIAQQEEIAEKMLNVTDSDELEKLLKKELELEEKLLSMTYEYMLITFDNNEKVLSVSYDKEMSEMSLNTGKLLKTTPKLSESSMLLYTAANKIKVYATAEFKDGSYKLAYVPVSAFAQLDSTKTEAQRLTWEDDWCEYTASFAFSTSKSFTVKGMDSKNFTIKLTLADGHTPENYAVEMTLSGSSEWRGRLVENDDFAPYLGYANLITKLTIERGVTAVNAICSGYGDYSFDSLETVVLNEGLTEISYYTFGDNVKNINIPVSVTKLGQTALYGGDFSEIIYAGTKAQWNAIEKARDWDDYAGVWSGDWTNGKYSFTVHCTDGDIEIEHHK